MEIKTRKTIECDLLKYDFTAGKDDVIQITEWSNGEGWDVDIFRGNTERRMCISALELDAIKYLTKTLEYEQNNDDNA